MGHAVWYMEHDLPKKLNFSIISGDELLWNRVRPPPPTSQPLIKTIIFPTIHFTNQPVVRMYMVVH